ncbi:MAG: hypothetical protein NZL96_01425 [Patescibacteria group bacterium]|nr:hypothetical protein [Patescibacteria group bacterium]
MIILFLFFIFISFSSRSIIAIECNESAALNCNLNKNCTQVIETCRKQQEKDNKLIYDAEAQIRMIISQYDLAVAEYRQTEQKVIDLEREIEILDSRIEKLDNSLTALSQRFLTKVLESYKQKDLDVIGFVFYSSNLSELVNKAKYIKIERNNNQRLLIQVQQAKKNFEIQKQLRDEKRAELVTLKEILKKRQAELQEQKRKKDRELAYYRNNLAEIKRILEIARQQIASFKAFSAQAKADIISPNQFGAGSDGNYYSQRDSRWANLKIGDSDESILDVGCLVTSVAMFAKKFGSSLTPADIASEKDRFFGRTAYMKLPWKGVAGKVFVNLGNNQEVINEELRRGNFVIVGVGSCYLGGSHFVVLIRKDENNYIMHDPIYGPDLNFSNYYSNICSAGTFR